MTESRKGEAPRDTKYLLLKVSLIGWVLYIRTHVIIKTKKLPVSTASFPLSRTEKPILN
jgi:hypothetical protein